MPSKRKDELFLSVFVTYLHFLIPTSDRVFSPRKKFRQIMFHIPNPCGSSAFEDEDWSFPPALLLSRAAHGKQQKGPLADTAAVGDLDLLSPLASYPIDNTHISFVIVFHCLGLHTDFLQFHSHYHRPQVNRQIYPIKWNSIC